MYTTICLKISAGTENLKLVVERGTEIGREGNRNERESEGELMIEGGAHTRTEAFQIFGDKI